MSAQTVSLASGSLSMPVASYVTRPEPLPFYLLAHIQHVPGVCGQRLLRFCNRRRPCGGLHSLHGVCCCSRHGRPCPPPCPDCPGGSSAPAARLSQCSRRAFVVMQMNPVPDLSGEEERELSFCRVREGAAGGGCCAVTHFRGGGGRIDATATSSSSPPCMVNVSPPYRRRAVRTGRRNKITVSASRCFRSCHHSLLLSQLPETAL